MSDFPPGQVSFKMVEMGFLRYFIMVLGALFVTTASMNSQHLLHAL